ncbi:MAG TPA: SCP2 sterol-binding domain-containing protein [Actinomycetota bacterium]|nr:SCP2 sterol-binding domain-containing protein [Actinomycetota bacterium]
MADQEQLDPQQLAEVIKTLSDEELAEQIKNMGADVTLKAIFDGMQDAFVPAKAAGVTSTIQYDITTDDGVKQWSVAIADGSCTTSEGPANDPRLTLQLSMTDFVRLIFGQADGTQLFMGGKLKLKGDMMFAMQMQGFFNQPG